tara:strand:- start:10679 stop:10849 length:171 start_codon:yes stop_codon:yes gene_type:complete
MLVKEFGERCGGDVVLLNCYKNKVEFGCKYNKSMEEKIQNISRDIEEYPWWVDLLD